MSESDIARNHRRIAANRRLLTLIGIGVIVPIALLIVAWNLIDTSVRVEEIRGEWVLDKGTGGARLYFGEDTAKIVNVPAYAVGYGDSTNRVNFQGRYKLTGKGSVWQSLTVYPDERAGKIPISKEFHFEVKRAIRLEKNGGAPQIFTTQGDPDSPTATHYFVRVTSATSRE